MDYIYAELNDDIRDTYYTGYLPENPDEESIGVIVDINNQTHKISADLSEATKELLANHDAAIKRHGEEIERVEGKLDAEISRAENAEAELSQALTDEITRAKEAEEQLGSDLTSESEVRSREDIALTNKIAVEAAARIQADNDISASLSTETTDRKAADTAIIERLDTAEDDIDANKTAIEKEVSDRTTAVSDVVSGYRDADLAINNKIGTVTEGKTVVDMISDAVTTTKSYADDKASAAQTAAEQSAADALSAAIQTLNAKDAELVDEDTKLSGLIGENTTAISNEVTARQNAVNAINTKIGAVIEGKDVVTMISDAQAAAVISANSYTNSKVSDLENGQVKTNTEAIATLSGTVSSEITNRENADTAIIERLDTAESDIDALEGRATAAEERLDTEESARKAEDVRLAGLIDNNASAITTEATTRSEADDAIKGRLNVIEGEGAGSVKKALQDAKSYADSLANNYDAEGSAAQALVDAKAYANDIVTNEKSARENADSALSEDINGISNRIAALEGEDGAISTGDAITLASAKAYADGLAGNYDAAGSASAAQAAAEQTAASALSAAVQTLDAKDAELVSEDTRLADLISDNTAVITKEIEDRAAAVKEVSDKVDVEKVSTAIAAAKSEAIAAAKSETDGQVSALTEKVNKNTSDISDLSNTVSSEISRVEGLVTAEETRAKGVEADFEGRIAEMEVFFKEEKVDGALNTLYEIQDYIDTHDGAVETMVSNINANATAIEGLSDRVDTAEGDIDALQEEFNTETGRVKVAEGKITALEGKVSTLEAASAKHAEKTYVNEELAKKVNVSDYETYQDAITDSLADRYTKTETDSKFGLKTAVENNTTNINTNASNITALTSKLNTAEDDIDNIETDFSTYKESIATALAGKQDVIAENTYDAYGSAAAVRAYVDGDFKTALITEDERLAGLIGANTADINTLKSTESVTGSVAKTVKDAVVVHNTSAEAHPDIRSAIPIKTSQLTNDSGFLTSVPEKKYSEEVTYAELKELRDNKELIPGMNYRITDYVTTTSQSDTQSAGHPFDITVTALSIATLSENASVDCHLSDSDSYFTNARLEAWEIKYCLDNDKTRFWWASESGCGVIYYLKDEYGNECPYDFKNIQFMRYKTSADTDDFYTGLTDEGLGSRACFTFMAQGTTNGTWIDGSIFKPYKYMSDTGGKPCCLNNKIQPYYLSTDPLRETNDTEGVQWLNNIVMYGIYEDSPYLEDSYNYNYVNMPAYNTFGNDCWNNTFGCGCYSNTFGNRCYRNTFGGDCHSNVFGDTCSDNTFGNECDNNTFGNECCNNTFGTECSYNTFGSSCLYNTFGSGCIYNTFGSGCLYNTFGDNCRSNTFGNECFNNTFGTECSYNTFGSDCSNNTFGNYCQYNIIDNGVYDAHPQPIDSTSSTYMQGIHIHYGVTGTFTVARGATYQQDVRKSGSQEILLD